MNSLTREPFHLKERAPLVHPKITAPVEKIRTVACTIPTDFPESDGTLEWKESTIVVAEVFAEGERGLGYTFADKATAQFIDDHLKSTLLGQDAMNIPHLWLSMVRRIRNMGRPGIASMAIAAVDSALWDLKARLLKVPLVTLLGAERENIPAYGSGGFTSYSIPQLQKQLAGWAEKGLKAVKMKIGRDPDSDLQRVRAAREAVGSNVDLFVDANGAYRRKQALYFAQAFQEFNVTWFEEPVTSDDLDGLRLLRNEAPAGMEITAGEYGYHLAYFRQMLDEDAVDVLQADLTRCAGLTEFLRVGALCQTRSMPLSAHTAPAMHVHACCALPNVLHVEYFHDHARVENLLFDGAEEPKNGILTPDLSRPGNGLILKRSEAQRYAVYGAA